MAEVSGCTVWLLMAPTHQDSDGDGLCQCQVHLHQKQWLQTQGPHTPFLEKEVPGSCGAEMTKGSQDQ